MADLNPTEPAARLALVIGNATYRGLDPLKNPGNDAGAVAESLGRLGFKVTSGIDKASLEMLGLVATFCRDLAEAAAGGGHVSAVLFYAGHGIQVDGENYLLPVDADIRNKLELRTKCIELDVVMEAMGASARTSVILLDCCRNNPLPRTLGGAAFRGPNSSHGLANVRAPKGVYVAFATQPHFVALDGEGSNSPFTAALLDHLDDPALQVSEVMMRVRLKVYEATRGEQIPWDHSALFEPFVFARIDPDKPPSDLPPEVLERLRREQEAAREESYWDSVKTSSRVRFVQSFVTQFPNSAHREAALARIDMLRRRSMLGRAAVWAMVALLAGGALYYGVSWMRYTRIANASIVGGDIEADDWREKSSYLWCKARCVVSSSCIAFTYDAGAERCQLKSEAAFYQRPRMRAGVEPTFSEIAYGYTQPVPTRFRLHWGRSLTGKPMARDSLEQNPQLKGKFRTDPRTKISYLRVSSLQCHLACDSLGEACKGFSHTRWGGGCELYSSVTGFFIDPRTGRPLFSPATISGCNDAAVEDCRPMATVQPTAPPGTGSRQGVGAQRAGAQKAGPDRTGPDKAGPEKAGPDKAGPQ